jgi:hypothetical protein
MQVSMTTTSDGRDFVNRRRHAEKAMRIEKMKRLVEEEQQREELEEAAKPNGAAENKQSGADTADAVPDINDKRCGRNAFAAL